VNGMKGRLCGYEEGNKGRRGNKVERGGEGRRGKGQRKVKWKVEEKMMEMKGVGEGGRDKRSEGGEGKISITLEGGTDP
jgi:hypothetical protein